MEKDEIIKRQFEKLPQEVKDAVLAADLPYKFQELGKKHSLHIDKMDILETETMFVLLGLLHPDEFQSELKARLGLTSEKTNALVEDVNKLILKEVREQLKKIYEDRLALEEEKIAEEEEKKLEEEEKKILEKTGVELESEHPKISEPEPVKEIKKEEEEILKTAGIQVMQKKPGPPKPSSAPTTEVGVLDREEVLRGVESPSEITPVPEHSVRGTAEEPSFAKGFGRAQQKDRRTDTIAEEKLRGAFKMAPEPESEPEKESSEVLESVTERIKKDPYLEDI